MAKKASNTPVYSLSKEEKDHLSAIQGMMSYISQVVRQDMSRYVDVVVKKRLAVPDDQHLVVDIEKGEVSIQPVEEPVVETAEEEVNATTKEN